MLVQPTVVEPITQNKMDNFHGVDWQKLLLILASEQGICFGMAAILDRADNNKFLLSDGNGIFADNHDETVSAIRKLSSSPATLADMKQKSKVFSKRELLYSSLVKKFY